MTNLFAAVVEFYCSVLIIFIHAYNSKMYASKTHFEEKTDVVPVLVLFSIILFNFCKKS